MLYTLLSIQLTMRYLPIPAKAPKINKVMGPRGIFLLFRAKKATRKTPTAKRSGVVKEDKAICNKDCRHHHRPHPFQHAPYVCPGRKVYHHEYAGNQQ